MGYLARTHDTAKPALTLLTQPPSRRRHPMEEGTKKEKMNDEKEAKTVKTACEHT